MQHGTPLARPTCIPHEDLAYADGSPHPNIRRPTARWPTTRHTTWQARPATVAAPPQAGCGAPFRKAALPAAAALPSPLCTTPDDDTAARPRKG